MKLLQLLQHVLFVLPADNIRPYVFLKRMLHFGNLKYHEILASGLTHGRQWPSPLCDG